MDRIKEGYSKVKGIGVLAAENFFKKSWPYRESPARKTYNLIGFIRHLGNRF